MTFHGLRGFSVRLYTARAGEFALCAAARVAGFVVGLLSAQVCVCDGRLHQVFMAWEQKVAESIIRWIQQRGVSRKAFRAAPQRDGSSRSSSLIYQSRPIRMQFR